MSRSSVLREFPNAFEYAGLTAYMENGSVSPFELSPFASEALSICSAEESRHMHQALESKAKHNQSRAGTEAIRRKRGG